MNRFLKIIFSLISLLAAFACKEEDIPVVPLEGSGITDVSWNETVIADSEGEMLSFTFTSAGKWAAESSADWCAILTPEGVAGDAALRIDVAPNTAVTPRTAEITIQVEEYPVMVTVEISQEEGVVEKGSGVYREVNEWIYRRMSETYLWNEPIPNLPLDYSIDYQSFLTSMLKGIAEHDDLNHDDGAYDQGTRTEFYTKIVSSAPTKTVGQQERGNGFYRLRPVDLGVAIGILVDAVIPGTPADFAGVKRGHFITAVNGVMITRDNYKSVTTKIYTDPVSISINTVAWEGANRDQAVITPAGDVELVPGSYVDPAIYKAETVTLSDGKKVGYLMYMGFHTDFDEELIAAFDKFKADGIDDLVLDLRYNNGGEIISSTVMATMIAGQKYKDQVLAKLIFNAARTAEGMKGEYKIGVPQTMEYPDGYPLIQEALQHSLDLERVYVIATNYTASASEIIINGLRGLDIEVNLIGTRTSGKNVGMEGFTTSYRNYDFLLYPVSFYIENAKGFRDYPDGFEPDILLDDSSYYPGGDFGADADFLCNAAYGWIRSGQKPAKRVSMNMELLHEPVSPVMESRMGGSLAIYR